MKGIFKSNPPQPRYQSTWDVQKVLTYLSSLGLAENLNLKQLTLKLTMLIALVSAQRGQSLHLLDLDFMKEGDSMVECLLPEHIKQSRPGYTPPTILLKAYPPDASLCVYKHMKEYITRTKSLRGAEKKLLISHTKPHHRISRETISRWIRTVMSSSGIDTDVFKPHSTRAATTSKAKAVGVPINDILSQAGWSSTRTFDRFYNKTLEGCSSFAASVLDAC